MAQNVEASVSRGSLSIVPARLCPDGNAEFQHIQAPPELPEGSSSSSSGEPPPAAPLGGAAMLTGAIEGD